MVPRVEDDAISIPSAALQTGQTGRFIMVMEDGTARRRGVELRRTFSDRAVISGEVQGGERVIVEGAQRVTNGSRVIERQPGSQPGQPARVSSAAH